MIFRILNNLATFYNLVVAFTFLLPIVSCTTKKVDCKAKQIEIQNFIDSSNYLKLKVDVHYSKSDKKGILVYLNGEGGIHDEIYDVVAKEYIASFLAYKFFHNEDILEDEALVFQFTHAQAPQSATWFEFSDSLRRLVFSYMERNVCYYKQLEYMILSFDPEAYSKLDYFMKWTDDELVLIKPSYHPKGLNFFQTLYDASMYSCTYLDSTGNSQNSLLDNMATLRILLLQKALRDNNDTNLVKQLNDVYEISNMKTYYHLGDLLIAFIMKDSLGTIMPDTLVRNN